MKKKNLKNKLQSIKAELARVSVSEKGQRRVGSARLASASFANCCCCCSEFDPGV